MGMEKRVKKSLKTLLEEDVLEVLPDLCSTIGIILKIFCCCFNPQD